MGKNNKEYAIALFELASESAAEQTVHGNLCLVKEVFDNTPELVPYLDSPGILLSVRLQTIRNAFENEVHEYVLSFLQLLCEHGDIELLFECITEYNKLYEQSKNLSRAQVTSAEELTPNEKARLIDKLEKLSGKKIAAEYLIDKGLLGGVKVEMDDGTIIDGSLRHRLESMKEVMIR